MRRAEERVQLSNIERFQVKFEEKKKKEEKNEAEALSNCDRNRFLHRSLFGVLHSSSS